MSQLLKIGDTDHQPFTLPLDAVARTFAFMGIVGSGKTSAAKRMAEEMARCGLPWMCLDPVGVWWGIRAGQDGTPGGYPAVVIGGPHGDLPIERLDGARIAKALISENVCAVIDLSRESKKFWHTFVTDFALELMQLNPQTPRHIFLEEAPEFVPQRTRVDLTARCKEAVDRLIRLGRNSGYGFSLITQRPAEVDKSVLSQMENLFILRTVGAHDRKALREWLGERGQEETEAQRLVWQEIKRLPSGHAFFWSPSWLNLMQKVTITPSTTFHPGATRQVGKAIAVVELSDVQAFVSKLQKQLSKHQVVILPRSRVVGTGNVEGGTGRVLSVEVDAEKLHALAKQVEQLRVELSKERSSRQDTERRLEAVKKLLTPDYDALRTIFETVGTTNGPVDASAYAPWLEKAGRAGCKRLLNVLIERQSLSRSQLATLGVVSERSSTFRAYMAWFKRNGLVTVEGEMVRLAELA